ncbi:hypothetical protein ACPXCO_23770 [Streptomyces cyaneofuscatus]|uniref:hypothetical protein n=1 Tax=Streptomyces cyaneofuscatus TaxID=66883 RepID=UPI003CEAFCCA
MRTLCRDPSSATTTSPAHTHHDRPDPSPRPTLAEALDLQESDVPRTADALEHFFPEA